MANYLSKPADYGQYTPPINLDLVNFVLQSKQQKYDYNLAKLENKISQELGSIDLARTKDREYFLNRANEAVSSAGDISKLDFSNSSVSRELDSRINSIVDERVLNDVISTSNYRNFQKTIQTKQQENPELYSAVNVAYAMEKQGVNDWLRGEDREGRAKDSLGQVTYEDYTDVGAELKDISENLDKYANVVKETTVDGLYFKTTEGKYLTAEEIRGIAKQQLSDKAKRQIQINGWANYDGGNAEARRLLTSNFKTYSDQRLRQINNLISKKELELKSIGDSNPEVKKRLTEELQQYKDNRRQTSESFNSWMSNNNFDSMSSTLEEDRVLSNFANAYAFNNVGTTLSTNHAALALQKIQMQAAAKLQSGVGGIEGATTTELFGEVPDRDLFQESARNAEKWESSFNQAVNQEFNKLSEQERDAVLADYDPTTGLSKEEYILEYMESLPGNKIISKVTLNKLDELRLRKQTYQEDYRLALEEGFKDAETGNIQSIVKEYYDNRGVEMLDDNGNVTSVGDYLKSKGITPENAADLNSDDFLQVKNNILKHYYADKILSKSGMTSDSKMSIGTFLMSQGLNPSSPTGGLANALGKAFISGAVEVTEEDSMMLNRLIELSGGDKSAEEFLAKSKEKGLYDSNSGVDSILSKISYVMPTFGAENLANRDNSVTDDATLNDWITVDKVKQKGGSYLNRERLRPGNRKQGLVIPASSGAGSQLIDILSSKVNTIDGEVAQFSKTKSAPGITIYESGPDTVVVSGSATVKGAKVPFEQELLKINLPQGILNTVEFETDEPIFNKNNMKPVDSKVSFDTMSDTRAFLDASYFLGDKELALGATREGLLQNLYNYYPDVMGNKINQTPYASAIENMLNSDNVFVKIEKEDGDFYTKVVSRDLKTGVETPLFSNHMHSPIPEEDYDEAYRKTKRVPQVYVAAIINSAVAQAQASPENPSETMVNILNLYGTD